jgi:hypothetical protein
MSIRGSTHQRTTGDPVSFGDIPPEVVRKAFVFLPSSDLASLRLVCRGLNPTAQDVIFDRAYVDNDKAEVVICGLHLRRLVGFTSFPVKSLELDIRDGGYSCAVRIAVYASRTMSSLKLDFDSCDGVRYYALRDILKQCRGIRHLQLSGFDVGDDMAGQDEDTLRIIKKGLRRLNRLELIRCRGNVLSIINHADIPNLQSFSYESNEEEDAEDSQDSEDSEDSDEIILAVAAKYPTLTSIHMDAKFDSSDGLLKVMGRCPDLKRMILLKKGGDLVLSYSDILSLRRLNSLDIDCDVGGYNISALAECKKLKSLRFVDWDLSEVLPVIGGNLVSLEIGMAGKDELGLIIKYCVGLQYLEFGGGVAAGDDDAIKNGLVKLSNPKVNGASIRLGTDWKGY